MDKKQKPENVIDLTELARAYSRWDTSLAKGDLTNAKEAENIIEGLLKFLPSGSGFDTGVQFQWEKSKANKLRFSFDYHHMKEGLYDGWTKHILTITPSFVYGYEMDITGRDKDDSKEYFYQVFSEVFWY